MFPPDLSLSPVSAIPRGALRLAVIGCGYIMREIYSPILAAMGEEAQVVGVYDIDGAAAETAAGRFPTAAAFPGIEILLRKSAPDAVLVLTSETANASVAQLVLEAGIPVYLEKPPAVTPHELERLLVAEAASTARVFAAFNRRHTPLFRDFALPASPLRRVSGLLARRGRAVETFPYTAVHLIDAAQFFTGRTLGQTTVEFQDAGEARWRLQGEFQDGAKCELEFVPNGSEHREYLVLEGDDYSWELRFPNPDGDFPEGGWYRNGAPDEALPTAHRPADPLEAMGYAPCLRHFLECLRQSASWPPHRLESARATLRAMDAMMAETA